MIDKLENSRQLADIYHSLVNTDSAEHHCKKVAEAERHLYSRVCKDADSHTLDADIVVINLKLACFFGNPAVGIKNLDYQYAGNGFLKERANLSVRLLRFFVYVLQIISEKSSRYGNQSAADKEDQCKDPVDPYHYHHRRDKLCQQSDDTGNQSGNSVADHLNIRCQTVKKITAVMLRQLGVVLFQY